MVDAHLKRSVAVLLSLLLVLPVGALAATTSTPVGAVRCVGTVFLGPDAVGLTSVIYSGDVLRTAEGKATITLPRGDLVVLESNSTVALDRGAEALTLGLEKGQLALASTSQLPLRVQAEGLTLSPAGSFPVLAELALLDDGTLRLAVHRGKVSVAHLRPELVVLSAGQLLTVNPRLAQTDKSKPIGTGAHGKMTLGEKLRTFRIGGLSHGASVALVAGVVGGAATAAIVVPLTVGTEEPVVSPSTP